MKIETKKNDYLSMCGQRIERKKEKTISAILDQYISDGSIFFFFGFYQMKLFFLAKLIKWPYNQVKCVWSDEFVFFSFWFFFHLIDSDLFFFWNKVNPVLMMIWFDIIIIITRIFLW